MLYVSSRLTKTPLRMRSRRPPSLRISNRDWSRREKSKKTKSRRNRKVRVFRIIPEFRILRLTFYGKSASSMESQPQDTEFR